MFIIVFVTITPPVGTHKWMLLYWQIMKNNMMHVYVIVDCTLINSYIALYRNITVCYKAFIKCLHTANKC